MNLFKKFFLQFQNTKSDNSELKKSIDEVLVIRADIAILQKELLRMQNDQSVILTFCKDTLLSKMKQVDVMSKAILNQEEQIIEVNKLINQHADAINNFLENYKKHIMDSAAHTDMDTDKPAKKQRSDN